MTKFDVNVLRSISGIDVPGRLTWGAAVTVVVAVEWLHGKGYVKQVVSPHRTINYVVTPEGREALRAHGQDGVIDLPKSDRI